MNLQQKFMKLIPLAIADKTSVISQPEIMPYGVIDFIPVVISILCWYGYMNLSDQCSLELVYGKRKYIYNNMVISTFLKILSLIMLIIPTNIFYNISLLFYMISTFAQNEKVVVIFMMCGHISFLSMYLEYITAIHYGVLMIALVPIIHIIDFIRSLEEYNKNMYSTYLLVYQLSILIPIITRGYPGHVFFFVSDLASNLKLKHEQIYFYASIFFMYISNTLMS